PARMSEGYQTMYVSVTVASPLVMVMIIDPLPGVPDRIDITSDAALPFATEPADHDLSRSSGDDGPPSRILDAARRVYVGEIVEGLAEGLITEALEEWSELYQ